MLVSGWAKAAKLLKIEVETLRYEGRIIDKDLEDKIMALNEREDDEKLLTELAAELQKLPVSADFSYIQPNELEEIRASRPAKKYTVPELSKDIDLLDLFHGAWLGRCTGCALGQPVEMFAMAEKWQGLKKYLELRNDWPLKDFFSCKNASDNIQLPFPECCKENISYMIGDDDLYYTLIGLKVLETHDKNFTWHHVAEMWDEMLPYNMICTAETQAILNYHIKKSREYLGNEPDITAEYTRSTNNPYREWIGAQIRADFWGWAAAGNPELAAEFAWRDASWTHTKNGIYGEMFIAAIEAAAFVEKDIRRLIEIGLQEIPEKCRLAEEIRLTIQKVDELGNFEEFMKWHDEHFANMNVVHTVNNASLVVMALLLGEGDTDKTICLSVAAGLDTDCNGATVGAIMGILNGAKNFGGILAPKLNDTLKVAIGGFGECKFADLAERTLNVYKNVNKQKE